MRTHTQKKAIVQFVYTLLLLFSATSHAEESKITTALNKTKEPTAVQKIADSFAANFAAILNATPADLDSVDLTLSPYRAAYGNAIENGFVAMGRDLLALQLEARVDWNKLSADERKGYDAQVKNLAGERVLKNYATRTSLLIFGGVMFSSTALGTLGALAFIYYQFRIQLNDFTKREFMGAERAYHTRHYAKTLREFFKRLKQHGIDVKGLTTAAKIRNFPEFLNSRLKIQELHAFDLLPTANCELLLSARIGDNQ